MRRQGRVGAGAELHIKGSSALCPAGECGPGGNWFKGKIDDIKVYHAALSPAEMYNLSLNQAGDLQSYSIGVNNRLTNTETGSYTYDHEGNRTSQYHDVGQQRDVYSWDHRNRLASVTRTGPREAVQFDFESDNAYEAVDALGRVMPGCFVGNVQLVDLEGSTHQNGTSEFGLEFDGNGDYVSLFIQDEFAVSKTGFSIMAYFHPEATSATMGIAGYGDVTSGKAGYRLYYSGTTGAEKLVFQLNDGVGSAQTVTHNIAGSFQNVWGHVAVTIDAVGTPSPKIRMYVGGTLVQSPNLTETNAWPAVQTEFTLGALGGGTTGLFTGVLDDVRIARMSLPEVDIDWAKDWSALTDHELAFTEYTYDHQNRLIARTGELDNGTTTPTITTDYLIHDGTGQSITSATPDPDNLDQVGQIVLRLDESGGVKNRYLWGAGVEQLLADEQVSSADTLWALTDHLGTIRDLVEYNGNGASVVVHRSYDSFGNVTSETNAGAVDVLFGYTGRMFDSATGLQNNLHRWLDPQVGRWISEDPIGFAAGDANVYRYVGNQTTNAIDPNGLQGTGGGSARDRLRQRAKGSGIGDEVDAVLDAADDAGTGWWLGLKDKFNRRWPFRVASYGPYIMTYIGPGFDGNDQGMSGTCGESAEEIWDAVKETGLDKSKDVEVILNTQTFGDAVHNFVQFTFKDGEGRKETYIVDNGFVGGPDHVGDYSDRKKAEDRMGRH